MRVVPMGVSVYAGEFAQQPLVFAHLIDAMPWLDLDHVDVICGHDPTTRLAHALEPADVHQVEDALGMRTTVVLIFDAAGPRRDLPERTDRLDRVARLVGRRHRPE